MDDKNSLITRLAKMVYEKYDCTDPCCPNASCRSTDLSNITLCNAPKDGMSLECNKCGTTFTMYLEKPIIPMKQGNIEE